MDIKDLADLPPLPLRQERGLSWFIRQANALDTDMGVIPRDDGIIFAFKGSSVETMEVAAAIDSYGNFLDLNFPPERAPVVLRYRDYIDKLLALKADEASNN